MTLTVTDPQNATGTDTVTATPVDPPANTAPTAHITSASCTNLSCSFNGATSSDPDSDTLTYDWNWGDGTAHSTTANPTHNYASPGGAKTLTLTVDDGHGHTATDTTTLNPADAPNTAPTAHITGVSCTDLTCSFTGSTSSDPENDTLTYSWDFGDSSALSTQANPSHAYGASGAQTVTLTVDDGHGHTATDTATANPTDPPANPVSHIAYVNGASTSGNRYGAPQSRCPAVSRWATPWCCSSAPPASRRPTRARTAGPRSRTRTARLRWLVRVYTRTATAADTGANVKVSVTNSGATLTKSDLTVAIYRNTDGTTPIAVSASKIDNAAGAAHTSPAVTSTGSTNWLLTYWADRSNTSTTIAAPHRPNAPTVRVAGPAVRHGQCPRRGPARRQQRSGRRRRPGSADRDCQRGQLPRRQREHPAEEQLTHVL